MRRKTPVLIATVALAALAACGGEPTPTPTPEESASATSSPTPTPSPTPSGPVRAPDDPNWTPNQLAAVQVIDRYTQVFGAMRRRLEPVDYAVLSRVVAEPQFLADVNTLTRMAAVDGRLEGGFLTPVERLVGEETTVDGHQQIKVVQCNEDAPDLKAYQGGVEIDVGDPRGEFEYVVRWFEADALWRIVLKTYLERSC
jgi:hypothetical protein